MVEIEHQHADRQAVPEGFRHALGGDVAEIFSSLLLSGAFA